MMSAVVVAARGWIGTPYRHQASVRGAGADCLGLLRGVWREVVGAEPETIPAYSPDWSEAARREDLFAAAGRWLDPVGSWQTEAWEPGAVLLFRMQDEAVAKHLGILSQGGEAAAFIHAYSGHGVVESPLSLPWRRRVAGLFRFPGH